MIKIDFHGSTHGHFLEYVTNVYVMQTTPSAVSIFKPPTYSAHNPDNSYLNNRLIQCGHYSFHSELSINDDDTIIRIIDDGNDDMFFIKMINLIHKAGDWGLENALQEIPDSVRNDPAAHRNIWYSKFNENAQYANFYPKFKNTGAPVFNFLFKSFFNLKDFYTSLNNLSIFLNQLFLPDDSLSTLWTEFIAVNQGWQSYIKCKQIIEAILSNNSIEIHCNAMEQGWINYNLSKIYRIYNGTMFDSVDYPTNTQIISAAIQNHLNSIR